MLQSVLLTLHVLVSLGLIGLVMVQHGRGADAGAAFGSGGSGTVFGAAGPAGFLTRATAVLAVLFFVISLSLAYITTQSIERNSVVERIGPLVDERAPNSDVPAVPAGSGSTPAGEGSDVPAVPATN